MVGHLKQIAGRSHRARFQDNGQPGVVLADDLGDVGLARAMSQNAQVPANHLQQEGRMEGIDVIAVPHVVNDARGALDLVEDDQQVEQGLAQGVGHDAGAELAALAAAGRTFQDRAVLGGVFPLSVDRRLHVTGNFHVRRPGAVGPAESLRGAGQGAAAGQVSHHLERPEQSAVRFPGRANPGQNLFGNARLKPDPADENLRLLRRGRVRDLDAVLRDVESQAGEARFVVGHQQDQQGNLAAGRKFPEQMLYQRRRGFVQPLHVVQQAAGWARSSTAGEASKRSKH